MNKPLSEKGKRLKTRFDLLLRRSGWGISELAGLLGYGPDSKSCLMRWKRGESLRTFISRREELINVLQKPLHLMKLNHRNVAETSAAGLEWFDPLDLDGITKLVEGITEEPNDDVWLAQLERSAPTLVTGRARYQKLDPAKHPWPAVVEMQLQNRPDFLGKFHSRFYRALQRLPAGNYQLKTVGGYFTQEVDGPAQVVEIAVPDEEKLVEQFLFGVLCKMMVAAIENPQVSPPKFGLTMNPAGARWTEDRAEICNEGIA